MLIIFDVSVGCVTSIAELLLLGHRWRGDTKRGRFKSTCGFAASSGFEVLRTREMIPRFEGRACMWLGSL